MRQNRQPGGLLLLTAFADLLFTVEERAYLVQNQRSTLYILYDRNGREIFISG